MSKGDPFNFNDIYTQMGADNLVKKPMSEIKRPAAAPSHPAKAPPPQSPEKVQAASKAYDLDFLGFGGAPKAAVPPPASAPRAGGSSATVTSFSNLGFNELFPSAPARTPAPSGREGNYSSGADPFAAFESVDGAMPVVKSTPISGAATPNASSTNLLNLEGDSAAVVSERHSAAPPPHSAAAPPPQAAAPLSPYPAIPEAAPAPSRYTPSMHPTAPPASTIKTGTASVHDSHQMNDDSAAAPVSQPPRTSHEGSYSFHRQDQPTNRAGTESSSSSSHNVHARGITGFFTDLRKKAVKAAQVGLQHLENALDPKEPGAGGKGWGSGHLAGSDSGEVLVTRQAVQYEAAAWAEPEDAGAAKALEVAVRIAELPMEVRSDALAQLKPELRTTVEEILREQVLLESEDRDAGGQQHTYQSVAPSMGDAPCEQQHEVADLLAADDVLTSNRQPGNVASTSRHDVADMDDFFSGAAAPPSGSTAPEQQGRPGTGAGDFKSASPAAAHQLLGDFVSGADELGSGYVQPAASDPGHGFGSFMSPAPGQPSAAAAPQQEAGDMGDFFRGGQTSAAPASPIGKPATAMQPSQKPSQMDLIGDLHSEGVDNHQKLYEDVDSQEGEPEVRRQLRAARLAERNGKMRAALAEKLAQDEEEARRKEEQVQLKDQHKQVIDTWKGKHKTNIRGLLGSLHTVLWENSGWAPVTVGDLLESTQVKKVYMKANLLVHPDKVRQRNGTAEQVAVADMVFDVLKEAWNAFKP